MPRVELTVGIFDCTEPPYITSGLK